MLTGVIWSIINAALSTGLTAGVFFFTSRLLSPSDFGHVALATAIVMFAAAIVPMAFGEALVQREEIGDGHLNGVFWICTGTAGAFYLFLVSIGGTVSAWLETDVLADILPFLALKLIFDAMTVAPEALVIRRMAFRTIALRTAIVNSIAGIVCLYLAFDGYALWALVLSQVLSSLISLIVTGMAAGWLPERPSGFRSIRQIASFGIYSMGSRILDGARIDQFLIGTFLGPATLGFYFFAVRINELLQKITTHAFSIVFSVSFSAVQNDKGKSKKLYLSGSFLSAAMSFPVFGGLILVAPTAVPFVFGPQWIEAVMVVRLTAAIGLIASVGILQAALIRASGGADWWFNYRVAVQAVGFLIILCLAPYGLTAIAGGLLLRTAALWPLSVLKTLRILQMSVREFCAIFQAPATSLSIMAVAVLAVSAVLPQTSAGLLFATQVSVGFFVYTFVLLFLARKVISQIVAEARNSKEEEDIEAGVL